MNPNNTPASSSSQPSAYPPRFSLAVFPDQVGFQIVQDDGHGGKVQKVENLAIIPPAKLRQLQMYLRSRQTAPYPERPFEVLYEGQTKYDPLCVLKPSSTRPAPPSPPLEPHPRLLPSHESDYHGEHTISHPYVDRYLSRPRLTRPRAWIPAERQDALLFALAAAKVLYEPSHPKYSFFWPRDDEVKKETIQLMYDVWSACFSFLLPSPSPIATVEPRVHSFLSCLNSQSASISRCGRLPYLLVQSPSAPIDSPRCLQFRPSAPRTPFLL